jgi:alpha-galactosidase
MPKIAMIGAGSTVFAYRLTCDILSFPELEDSVLALVDVNPNNLELSTQLVRKAIKQEGLPAQVISTDDRREALDGADYVIAMFRVGGLEAIRPDLEIPRRYGVDQSVGDTLGPGGILYGLRHIPILMEICRDMQELCPDALLMNYANPMAAGCWAINQATQIANVGLCHSVQGTSKQLASYIGAPLDEITYWAGGINHMDWFLRFEWNGEDAYPLLHAAMENPEIYAKDPVRFEIMRHFGHFVSESSGHMSEYVPYFRRTPELMDRYSLKSRDVDANLGRRENHYQEIRKRLASDEPLEFLRTHEYCSRIIHAMETNTPFLFYGNVENTGLITNLPDRSCVEVPCLVDATGLHPCHVGELPPQCAGLNRTNISVQELIVKAALEGDRDAVYQAMALDPLTAALLPLDKIRKMADELLAASAPMLPQFA